MQIVVARLSPCWLRIRYQATVLAIGVFSWIPPHSMNLEGFQEIADKTNSKVLLLNVELQEESTNVPSVSRLVG